MPRTICHGYVKQYTVVHVIVLSNIFAAMAKRLVNIFLILVLSVQMLPIQQMGRALFSNMFTEEIPHSLDVEKDFCKKMQGKSEFIDWANEPVINYSIVVCLQPVLNDAAIPHNHSIEILVPPPNC